MSRLRNVLFFLSHWTEWFQFRHIFFASIHILFRQMHFLPVAPVNRVLMSSLLLVKLVSHCAHEYNFVPLMWSKKMRPILKCVGCWRFLDFFTRFSNFLIIFCSVLDSFPIKIQHFYSYFQDSHQSRTQIDSVAAPFTLFIYVIVFFFAFLLRFQCYYC